MPRQAAATWLLLHAAVLRVLVAVLLVSVVVVPVLLLVAVAACAGAGALLVRSSRRGTARCTCRMTGNSIVLVRSWVNKGSKKKAA